MDTKQTTDNAPQKSVRRADYANRKERPLTLKEHKFIHEYMIDMNATQAAIRSGYKPKSAVILGYRLMCKPRIREAIHALQEKFTAELEITPKRVLKEWASIAFANANDYGKGSAIDLTKCSREQLAALDIEGTPGQPMKIRLSAKVKAQALEALSKHLGLFEKDNEQQRAVFPMQIVMFGKDGMTKQVQSVVVDDLKDEM